MLSQEARQHLLQQLASSNHGLLDRLMNSRQELKSQLKYNYCQQVDTEGVEVMASDTKYESWDDLVANDLQSVNANLKEQLQRNEAFQEQFNRTLQEFMHQQPEVQTDSDWQPDRHHSEHQPMTTIDAYQNHSDDENVKHFYASKKDSYLKTIVKKYGQRCHTTKNHACDKHQQSKEMYPFKPETHTLPRQIYGEEAQEKVELSKEAIWERLLANKRALLDAREQEKREKDFVEVQTTPNRQFKDKCPFKPQISPISQLLAESSNTSEPVETRLVREGIENKRRIEQMQREKYQKESFNFQPQVSKECLKGDKATMKPIHERIDDIIKRKQEQLIQMKIEQEKLEDRTFKPKISEKSTQIAEAKLSSKSVIDRLMQDAIEKAKRRLAETQEHQKTVSEECTFVPAINPCIDAHGREFNHLAQQEFVQKQYLMADFLREKKELLLQEFMKQQNYTFKPEVNKLSALLVEADPDRQAEDLQQRITRLSRKDNEKRTLIQEQLKEAYYGQFSFKPQINQISAMIGRKRSLESLAYNREGQERLKQKREEAELEQRQECSFQPQVQRNHYQHIRSKYSNQNIKANLETEDQMKKRRVQELQKKLEYEELKECTFKPQTNKEIRAAQEPLAEKVRGLDKFIQNKENHRRIQNEKSEREKEVFGWEAKYDEKKHAAETRPQPFKLSMGNPTAIRNLQEEAIQREREQCTFIPKINVTSRQLVDLNYADMINQM